MSTHTYLIEDAEAGLVKIGHAANPWARMSELQAGNPRELRIVALLPPGGETEERAMHRRFYEDRVRGEWFRWSPDLRELAVRHAVPEVLLPEDFSPERAVLLALRKHAHPVRASALKVAYPWPRAPRASEHMHAAGVAQLCLVLARRGLVAVDDRRPKRYELTAEARGLIDAMRSRRRSRSRADRGAFPPPSPEQTARDRLLLGEAL